ncbi:MAG: hypothetical protein A2V84_10255 [Chloroflexi bacterium RBG_16_70_13]|nr:MAG: hypothetical protein A2V84_10255 [Chloroflexi bacterium RBG_16_70_13]
MDDTRQDPRLSARATRPHGLGEHRRVLDRNARVGGPVDDGQPPPVEVAGCVQRRQRSDVNPVQQSAGENAARCKEPRIAHPIELVLDPSNRWTRALRERWVVSSSTSPGATEMTDGELPLAG